MDDDDLTEYPTQRIRLQQCPICGRQFKTEIFSKHQAICRKVSTKKRKIFDAGRQRAANSDVPYKATRQTAQVYNGEARPQDEKSKYAPKPNWRQKHNQLIQSIREARSVTRAMKEGGPLPAFRPSEVPSDYVNCPYCHRNFNQHVAERHIPFCQTQHERKHGQNSRPNQQFDRGRSRLPPPPPPPPQQQQQPAQYRQQPHSYSTSAYSGQHDVYSNGYKHSNSAPMIVRRNPSDYQQPPPPPRKTSGGDGGNWGFRKLFGIGSKQDRMPPSNYYAPEDDDYYEPAPPRRPAPQPVLMRTGRTQENTSLNVHARQRNDEVGSYVRRIPPLQHASSSSYGQPRHQYSNNQYNSMRPTAVGRPTQSIAVRCGDCGSVFNNISARYCPQCGSRR